MGVTSSSRCEECGTTPAPVRYTEIDTGRVTKRALCRACAEKRGLLDTGPKSVVVLQQLLGSPPARRSSGREAGAAIVCTGCGLSLAEFRTEGRLGCARCYTTFHAALAPLLRKLHGATRHTGRTPRSDGRITELRRRVEALRAEIDRAVRSEEYERAAGLRDELRAVEAEQSVAARGAEGPPEAGSAP